MRKQRERERRENGELLRLMGGEMEVSSKRKDKNGERLQIRTDEPRQGALFTIPTD